MTFNTILDSVYCPEKKTSAKQQKRWAKKIVSQIILSLLYVFVFGGGYGGGDDSSGEGVQGD